MRRREFITLLCSVGAWPLAARAQQTAKVPRMGYLSPGSPPASQAFWQGMRDLGYVEDKNIFVEYRWAEGEPARLPDLAAELSRLNVDVIFALGSQATFAVKSAATTTPVVFTTHMPIPLKQDLSAVSGDRTGLSPV